MKSGRFFLALFLAAALLLGGRGAASAEYVRLHIRANSDSAEDQALKLEVRDAVLACAVPMTEECESAREAYETLAKNLPVLTETARARARELGFEGEVSAEMGEYAFPDRQYGSVVVPAGDYPALRLLLGRGEGRNWWCVIYPDLCAAGRTDASDRPYSSLWRWLWGAWRARWGV